MGQGARAIVIHKFCRAVKVDLEGLIQVDRASGVYKMSSFIGPELKTLNPKLKTLNAKP